ncbi:hypothetical protein N8289_00305 [Flavobacteriales bacterium]|nr:hypothetical protein [Flavobacteriales bacterium]
MKEQKCQNYKIANCKIANCPYKTKENFLPADLSLPFFTYGIFRPGEIPYIGIKEYIDRVEPIQLQGKLVHRDGVLLFNNDDSQDQVIGYLIYFKENKNEDAYNFISTLEPEKLFVWEMKEEKKHGKLNLLIGKTTKRGSVSTEQVGESFFGHSTVNDPYFTTGLSMLKNFQLPKKSEQLKSSFEVQMHYLFLWTILERFTFFRYSLGGGATMRVNKLAANRYFIKAIELHIKPLKNNRRRKIFSALNLKVYVLNETKPKKVIEYYYQVRSNLTHRGKGIEDDYAIIRDAFQDLLNITEFVLNETIKECKTDSKRIQ